MLGWLADLIRWSLLAVIYVGATAASGSPTIWLFSRIWRSARPDLAAANPGAGVPLGLVFIGGAVAAALSFIAMALTSQWGWWPALNLAWCLMAAAWWAACLVVLGRGESRSSHG